MIQLKLWLDESYRAQASKKLASLVTIDVATGDRATRTPKRKPL